MATDVQILDLIRRSVGYKLIDPRDKKKVNKALAGEPSLRPSSLIGQAAWELAKRIAGAPGPTGPTGAPPPSYVKVAPRVAYKTDRGDARFCMFNPDGTLRPGVSRREDGYYTDESGAVYARDGDGLEESSIRSPEPAVTASDSIDGRPYCSLPLIGDPAQNTGSWKV